MNMNKLLTNRFDVKPVTTITVYPDWRLRTDHAYSKKGNAAYCYTVGHEPPHYPVPTPIMYEVDFDTWYTLEK